MLYKEIIIAAKKEVRKNSQIKVSEVRLIDEDGTQLGILSISEAIELASNKGMDVVRSITKHRATRLQNTRLW